jgi:hypothetical protein
MPSRELCAYYERVYAAAQIAAVEAVRQEVLSRARRYPEVLGMNPMASHYIPGECCGCTTVRVNGNSSFGRWAKKNRGWKVFDPPGVCLNEGPLWQSYERDLAYARGFVAVLREAGINAWYTSRLD